MKKIFFVSLIVICFAFQSAFAISLTDYKYPESTSQEAWLSGNFSLDGNSSENSQAGFDFGGSALYNVFYRSLPFSYELKSNGNFDITRSTEKDAESQEAYNAWAFSKANKYLSSNSKLFGYGSMEADYRKLKSQEDADDPYVKLIAGAGYGRTIDATVLKRAMRMNQDFKKYGVITGDIPDAALLELAGVIDNENEYRSKYGGDEYEQYWYEAMEEVIRKSGVLKEGSLGAIGILRIQEVLEEAMAPSYYGWEARVGIGAVVSDYDGESGDPTLEAVLDWSRPYSIHLQLNNTTSYNTVFEDEPTHRIQDIFQVYYELSDRIDWDNVLRINYDILTLEDAENILSMNFTSKYIFDIVNDLYFNPSFSFNFIDDGIENVEGDTAEWNWKIWGGITYRLK